MNRRAATVWVAGVDGCRAGWLVVLRMLDDPRSARAILVTKFCEVLALPEAPVSIAVDIPIGLPETVTIGGRRADIEARANLGRRKSVVFPVPARAAVLASDYQTACSVAAANSTPPRKVSQQAFHLFPKMREVDALMTPELQACVVECHPELAFWALNEQVPLAEPKKVKSRAHAPGLERRRRLLERAGYSGPFLESAPFKAKDAGADDLLDATAASWTAARIVHGQARRFPADPPRDAKGVRAEIWA